jgi:hypothetical protein
MNYDEMLRHVMKSTSNLWPPTGANTRGGSLCLRPPKPNTQSSKVGGIEWYRLRLELEV